MFFFSKTSDGVPVAAWQSQNHKKPNTVFVLRDGVWVKVSGPNRTIALLRINKAYSDYLARNL